jgi:hypothetical protein
LIFQNANLPEVPNYFVRTIKNVIANGVPLSKSQKEIPAAEGETSNVI